MPQKIVSWGVSLGYFCCTFSCCLFFPTVVLSGLYFVFIKKNALFSSGQVNDAFTSSRNTSVPILPYHHHFWHMTWYALDIKPILSFAIFFSHHQPATEKSKSYNLQSKTMLKTNEKWLIQPLSVLFLLYFFLFYFFFKFPTFDCLVFCTSSIPADLSCALLWPNPSLNQSAFDPCTMLST